MKIVATGRHGVAMILMLALLPSCVGYRSATTADLRGGRPHDLRLTMEDQSQVVLLQAHLQSDTVRGFASDGPNRRRREQSVALSDVQAIELRGLQTVRTVAVGLLILGGAFYAVASSIDVP